MLSLGLPEHILFSPAPVAATETLSWLREMLHIFLVCQLPLWAVPLSPGGLPWSKLKTPLEEQPEELCMQWWKGIPSPTCVCFWNQHSQLNCNLCCVPTSIFIICLLTHVLFFLWTNFAYQTFYWNPVRLDPCCFFSPSMKSGVLSQVCGYGILGILFCFPFAVANSCCLLYLWCIWPKNQLTQFAKFTV